MFVYKCFDPLLLLLLLLRSFNMRLLLLLVASWAVLGLTLADSSYNHFRLPTALRPQKYNLRVLTHFEDPDNLRFEGDVKILFKVLENANNITLHAKNLTIDESLITLRDTSSANKKNCVSGTEVNAVHDFYVMRTCEELVAGDVYELTVPFAAELNRQLEGYYRSSYIDPVTNKSR